MKLRTKKIIATYVIKMDTPLTHVSLILKGKIKIILEKTIIENNNIKNESNSTDTKEENTNVGFSGNIMVNSITQTTKENANTEWIIDSGCPINLTNEIKKLKNTKNIKNKSITYPNGKSEKIKKVGKYIGVFDNDSLKLSNVYYADNIKNNLLSTHYLVVKG